MNMEELIQDKRHAKDPNNFKYAKLKIYAPEKSDLHEITLTCIKTLDHNGAWDFDIQSIYGENTNIITFKYNGTIAAMDAVQKLHFNCEHTVKFEWGG